jgi:hypothetical protein
LETVARGQRSLGAAEAEIERFIERRAQKGETDVDETEKLWKESRRRVEESQHRQNVAAWFAYFCRMADNHRGLSEEYERRAEELCEEGEE